MWCTAIAALVCFRQMSGTRISFLSDCKLKITPSTIIHQSHSSLLAFPLEKEHGFHFTSRISACFLIDFSWLRDFLSPRLALLNLYKEARKVSFSLRHVVRLSLHLMQLHSKCVKTKHASFTTLILTRAPLFMSTICPSRHHFLLERKPERSGIPARFVLKLSPYDWNRFVRSRVRSL